MTHSTSQIKTLTEPSREVPVFGEFDVVVHDTDGRGFPLQHSGESVGDVEHFRLRVVEEPVRFLSFLPKRR